MTGNPLKELQRQKKSQKIPQKMLEGRQSWKCSGSRRFGNQPHSFPKQSPL